MKKLKYLDKGLLFFTTILFALGLLMILSSSHVVSFMSGKEPFTYLYSQLGWFIVGTVAFALIMTFSNKFFRNISFLGILLLLFILILVLIQGKLINNARSWFDIGPFSFQPSEFLKIVYIVWAASFYDKHKDSLNGYIKAWTPPFYAAIGAGLIYFQPDLGTMIIFTGIVAVIFLVAPIEASVKLKSTIVVGFLAVAMIIILLSSGKGLRAHQRSRFDLGRPCSEEKFYTNGNQLCNGYIAINNGGLLGKGLGGSTQKHLYIPEAHTDFIFTIIVEELGALAGIAIIGVMMIVIWRIVMIGKRSLTVYGAIVCYGVATYIFVHMMVNLTGVLGIFPMTGVPLPFISYGGTYTISLMAALSFVQKINIETKMRQKA